ncbi:serine hydrolase [Parvibaculum sp.]|uniref:serine hydrolase n=1 Tax=Parvibaculum sp. TaxID=2024848 RepID=UPI002733060F|nr:serine hydrolase [Parvibaculum sp.]MDP3326999.1 serine hydrolase [Parvibaculum sp.]
MTLAAAHFQQRLETLVRECGVPGASLAVWGEGELLEAAAGVCNLETRVPATSDTLFQIGSITKLYTAALIMQLVEEGKLDLDAPVRKVLPEFRVKDEAVAAGVTLRQLLSHTSGVTGDFFKDAGRGEDRVAKFVSMMAGLEQVHAPGEMFSYCNTGFVAAGRMIEVANGTTWDKAIRTRISKLLDTPAFSTLPEQAMRYQTAIGHLGAPGALMVTPIAYLAASNGPAGATPMARARDIVTFARMMMNEGVAPNGKQVLSAESVHAMHLRNVACPKGMNIDAIGLATFMWDWDGDGHYEVFGHDGSTIGQAAWLRYHPESETALCLLTNGGNGKAMADALIREVFAEAAGIAPPELPTPDASLVLDAARYAGRYANSMEAIEVTAEGGKLVATVTPSPDYAVMSGGPKRTVLEAVNTELFLGVAPGMTLPQSWHFIGDEGGRARWLHLGVRAHRRV